MKGWVQVGSARRIVAIVLMAMGGCCAAYTGIATAYARNTSSHGAYTSSTSIHAARSARSAVSGGASLPAAECTSYVSPSGSDSNPGTKARPWRTAQRAFDAVEAGQTICFRGGIYPMVASGRYSQTLMKSKTKPIRSKTKPVTSRTKPITSGTKSIMSCTKSMKAGTKSGTKRGIKSGAKSGTEAGTKSGMELETKLGAESGTETGIGAQRITITNYPGEVAIIEGSTRVEAWHVIFRGTPDAHPGLVFQGPTGRRLGLIEVMYSHDVTFDHVEIRGADYHAGFYQYGGDHIRLLGSYIHDNGIAGSNLDQGIYWDKTSGSGNLIANCAIELTESRCMRAPIRTSRRR
jgi:hypothetical protein